MLDSYIECPQCGWTFPADSMLLKDDFALADIVFRKLQEYLENEFVDSFINRLEKAVTECSILERRFRKDLHDKVVADLLKELREKVWGEHEARIRSELWAEIQAKRPQLESELIELVKSEMRESLRESVREELREELLKRLYGKE